MVKSKKKKGDKNILPLLTNLCEMPVKAWEFSAGNFQKAESPCRTQGTGNEP